MAVLIDTVLLARSAQNTLLQNSQFISVMDVVCEVSRKVQTITVFDTAISRRMPQSVAAQRHFVLLTSSKQHYSRIDFPRDTADWKQANAATRTRHREILRYLDGLKF